MLLDPPAPIRPFSGHHRPRTPSFAATSVLGGVEGGGGMHSRPASSLSAFTPGDRASTSLSLNYLPSKFSDVLAHGGARRRKRVRDGEVKAPVLARGGGVDAFRRGEARMPDDRDDLRPVEQRKGWFDRSDAASRWTRFKWVLFVFNAVYTMIAMAALLVCVLVWLDIFDKSDVIRVANRTPLVFSTLAAAVALFTSVFGWAGVMLNNRSFLALYNLFLWFSFAFLVVPGYITYRRSSLNLEAKINFEWSELLDIDARRRIQNALHCCGYYSPYIEASISSTCYARSILPGCKSPYLHFERLALRNWYISVFSIAAFHIGVIVAALLCSNHVTYRFGKGMMPKRYRLDEDAVAIIMENYAAQLADEYGPQVAAAVLAQTQTQTHSRAASTVDLDHTLMRPMSNYHDPFAANANANANANNLNQKYGTIGGTVPETVT
ncbi:hypothetical protein C8F01DRAFT_144066 [Mycena amicta]|nr:hypothetical protein C8F01DRAFT_144066 [Mycena amicta]